MNRIQIIFYSLKGETFAPGRKIVNLEKGHTAVAAGFVQEAVGGDLFEVETVRDYASDHLQMIREAKEEYDSGNYPELRAYPDLSSCDTIFLGFPNWFGTIPTPIFRLLQDLDWSGKRIIPFVTSGGTGLGKSLEDIRLLCPGAQVSEGGAFLGHLVEQSKDEIMVWARGALAFGN